MVKVVFAIVVALLSALRIVAHAAVDAITHDAAANCFLNSAPVATAYATVTAVPAIVTVIATEPLSTAVNTTTSASNAYEVLSDSFSSQNATILNTTATVGPITSHASACSRKTTSTSTAIDSLQNGTVTRLPAPSISGPLPLTVTSTTVIADSPSTTSTSATTVFSNGMIPGFTAASTVNANTNAGAERKGSSHALAGAGGVAIIVARFGGAMPLLL